MLSHYIVRLLQGTLVKPFFIFWCKILDLGLLRSLYANTPSKFPGSKVLLYCVLIKVKRGRTECMT